MNSIKRIITLILGFGFIQPIMAQEGFLMDSVVIDLGDHRQIEIISENFHTINQKGKIDSIYDLFVGDLNKVATALISSNTSNSMVYDYRSDYRRIQMNSEKVVSAEVFVDKQGKLIYFQNVEIALGKKDILVVKASSIEGLREIASFDLDKLIEKADDKVFPDGALKNKHKSVQLVYLNNQFSDSLSKMESSPTDFIELGLGFGLGTVRSTLTPDFEISMILGLSRKGRIYHKFGFSNQWMYSFSGNGENGYRINMDGFLDAVYSISSRNKTTNLISSKGIKVGMLVKSSGKTFREDAFRIALFKGLSSGLSLEGGFFTEDGFSQAFPYARLAWSW